MHRTQWFENLELRKDVGDLFADLWNIFKLVLKLWCEPVNSIHVVGTNRGAREHSNESSGFVNAGNFLSS
jgi:hypothetical protein